MWTRKVVVVDDNRGILQVGLGTILGTSVCFLLSQGGSSSKFQVPLEQNRAKSAKSLDMENATKKAKTKRFVWSDDVLEVALKTAVYVQVPEFIGRSGVAKKWDEVARRLSVYLNENNEEGAEEIGLTGERVRKKLTAVTDKVRESDSKDPPTGTGEDVFEERIIHAARAFIQQQVEAKEARTTETEESKKAKEAAQKEILEAAMSMQGPQEQESPAKRRRDPFMEQLLEAQRE